MSGLLVALDAFVARLDSGVNKGFFGPVNVTQLEITDPDPDQITRVSYQRSSYGQALDAYNRPKPSEITIKFDDVQPDLLSMALRGLPASYSQSSRTSSSGTFTARHDKWVALGHNALTAFTISGKTVDVDYAINLDAGLVKVLSTGTIADEATVTYSDSCPARTAQRIVAGTVATLQLQIYGFGTNLFTDSDIELTVWRATVSPSGAQGWISADPISVTLKGVLTKPDDKDGAYEYIAY